MSAEEMKEMEIRAAYVFLRQKNHSIPSDTLQFMLDASLEKLKQVKNHGDVESKIKEQGGLEAEVSRLNLLSGARAMLIKELEAENKEQGGGKEVKWMVYHKKYVEWLTKYNGKLDTMEAGMSKPNQPDYFRANND